VTEPPYQRVRELLFQALKLTGGDRLEYLDRVCADDAALRAEVDSLIPHVEDENSPLEGGVGPLPLGPLAAAAEAAAQRGAADDDAAPQLPERIGPFRIVRRLATGGMGTVYEAVQDSPSRRVALKTLRRELLSPTLLRRFHRETEILGLLQHPGIAQVYEAGTAEGPDGSLPYFAMEFVDGEPLVAWADGRRLDEPARLELFAQICDAVHHAHTQGVIHRDLKPDNILVTTDGHPKVLDFGVARATDADIQTTTLVTEAGQIMGTLPYMSPEQVSGDPDALDARSDVYALGVVLFELLAGRRPHDLGKRSMPEAARVIREEDATRLGSVDTRYRGDMETIVGKALDKDPERRYASAAELARDLRRYLSDQPIVAHPPSSFYLLRKFARRHRGLVGGVAAGIFALIVGLAFAVNFGLDEAEQRRAAEVAVYRATLGAVSTSLEAGVVLGIQDMLDAVPEPMRGWEWDHLSSRTTRHLWEAGVLEDTWPGWQESEAYGVPVVFSHDGERVVSLLDEQTLGVWGAASGEQLHRIDIGAPIVPAGLTSGPGGVAVLTQEARLVICDDRAGAVSHSEQLPGTPLDAEWDPHGGLLAVSCVVGEEGDDDRGVLLVGAPGSLTPVNRRPVHVEHMAWASGGRTLLAQSAYRDETPGHRQYVAFDTRTWDSRQHEMWAMSSLAAATSPGAGLVAAATGSRDVQLFELGGFPGSPPRATLQGHQERDVRAIAVSRDGTLVASASKQGSLRLWDGATGEVLEAHELVGNPQIAISPTGRFVALTSGGRLRVLSPGVSSVLVLPGPGAYVYGVAWTPDGRTVVARDMYRESVAYDALDGRPLGPALPRPSEARSELFPGGAWGLSVDGTRLCSVSSRGELFAVDLVAGAAHASLEPALTDGADFDLARRAFWRASGRLDPASGRSAANASGFARNHASVGSFVLDPAARSFVAPEGRELHDALTGACIQRLAGQESHHAATAGDLDANMKASFSPDGARVAITRLEAQIKVFDTATGELLGALPGHDGAIYAVDWSPDGARLASGGNDATIRIWDADTYEPLALLRGHRSYVKDVAWSPDGRTLASASGDGTVRLWGTIRSVDRAAQIREATVRRAQQRPMVEQLFARLDDPQAVADALRAATDLDDEQRHAALRVVRQLANDWHARRAGEGPSGR